MSELLLKTIVEKLENLETEVQQLKGDRPASPDYMEQLEKIKADVTHVQADLALLCDNLQFPAAVILQLSKRLKECTTQLQQPLKQDIRHHHHLMKGIIISCALLILLSVCACWIYQLYNRQGIYKANDIKYRHLKLLVNPPLQALLYETDSLYRVKGKAMRDIVIRQEEARQRRMELEEKAEHKEMEATLLREQAKRE